MQKQSVFPHHELVREQAQWCVADLACWFVAVIAGLLCFTPLADLHHTPNVNHTEVPREWW